MKKRMLSWVLLLMLALPLGAQAATRTFQDLASFSRGGVREEYTLEKDDYRMKAYEALNGNGEWYAYDYAGLLDDMSDFVYIGAYGTGEWVHLCFEAGLDFHFDTFRLKSYGEVLTPYSVVIVSYRPNNKTIYVRYSKDLMPKDHGSRSSSVPPSAGSTGAGQSGSQSGNGVVQDPASYSGGAVRYTDNIPKDAYRQKAYKVLNGNSSGFVYTYCDMLAKLNNLTYLGVYDTGGWVHHCFAAGNGYHYDTFRLTSYGEVLTPYCVLIASWEPTTSTIYVRYSKDITLSDLGYRQ